MTRIQPFARLLLAALITLLAGRGDAETAFVVKAYEDRIQVVDVQTGVITGGFPSLHPWSVTPDLARDMLWVISGTGSVTAYDALTYAPKHTTRLVSPRMGVMDPNGSRLYVADFEGHAVVALDPATGAVLTRIPVRNPSRLDIAPDGSLYVNSYVSGQVMAVDTVTHGLRWAVKLSYAPLALRLNQMNGLLYATDTPYSPGRKGNLYVIDPADGRIVSTVSRISAYPADLVFAPDGVTGYVAHTWEHTVGVYDIAARTLAGSVPVGRYPTSLAVDVSAGRLLIANSSRFVDEIDLVTNSRVAGLDLGSGLGSEVVVAAPVQEDVRDGKVTLCHTPPGNAKDSRTLEVSSSAVRAHLDHGDLLGTCSEGDGRRPGGAK